MARMGLFLSCLRLVHIINVNFLPNSQVNTQLGLVERPKVSPSPTENDLEKSHTAENDYHHHLASPIKNGRGAIPAEIELAVVVAG